MKRVARLSMVLLVSISACKTESPSSVELPPARFESAKASPVKQAAAKSFCDFGFPATGEASRKWTSPATRELPGKTSPREYSSNAWTWVNLWATWCEPCMSEMPLMKRWRESLRNEGMRVNFELWSVDEEAAPLASMLQRDTLPAHVEWLRSQDDLPAFLDSLGVNRNSAIPIHAFVDPQGMLRCVRVGTVWEESYGMIKAILSDGAP